MRSHLDQALKDGLCLIPRRQEPNSVCLHEEYMQAVLIFTQNFKLVPPQYARLFILYILDADLHKVLSVIFWGPVARVQSPVQLSSFLNFLLDFQRFGI